MRQLRDVLHLRFGLGLNQDQIARSCSIGQATVHRYLERAVIAGLGSPLGDEYDDRKLQELLFPARTAAPSLPARRTPDFADIRRQLQTHEHLTLQAGLGGIS